MRKSLLLLPLLILCCGALSAQTTHKDSVTEIAKADAENFMLNKEDLKTFRRIAHKRRYSDLFKPKAADVSDIQLLKDSDYVQAYRHVAFIKTRKRHTTGHYIVVIGSAIMGATIVLFSIFLISTGGGLDISSY